MATNPIFADTPPQGGYAPLQGSPLQEDYPPPRGEYAGAPHDGYAGAPAPQQGQWMPLPQGVPGCPRGLEYLAQIDQLFVLPKVELLEASTGFETNNKYDVINTLEQNVYFAVEDNDCCTRPCGGPFRSFDMKILDNAQQEVIHLERSLRCASCWTPYCLHEMAIAAPPGTPVGYIGHKSTILLHKFEILDEHKRCVLKIGNPSCACHLGRDVQFKVMTKDDQEVGKILMQRSDLGNEAFPDVDNFDIQFPIDLDVKIKACLLGAVFLINCMFFEQTNN